MSTNAEDALKCLQMANAIRGFMTELERTGAYFVSVNQPAFMKSGGVKIPLSANVAEIYGNSMKTGTEGLIRDLVSQALMLLTPPAASSVGMQVESEKKPE